MRGPLSLSSSLYFGVSLRDVTIASIFLPFHFLPFEGGSLQATR